ncbi:hypothetical protein ACFYOK_04650 [Microbispora bryophytorum]|uniref:hypothetical protein n=1 Tax=Microbispora bryophytorum TaxID=1460882 RepID=UPI0033DCDBB7
MNWNITAAMVTELTEHHGRADETGIILTPDGWEVATWAGRRQDSALVAMTKDDTYGWMDGDELDQDDAEALATSEDHRIPDEDGTYGDPAEDANPQVVTGTWTGRLLPSETDFQGEAETSWQDAWWFDQAKAVQLIDEKTREYAESGTASSLWRTPGGRYVMHTRTLRDGYHETWTELGHTQIAEWAYAAGDEMCEVEQPPVVVAARAARTIADALIPPRVPWFDGDMGERFHRADRVMDEAAEIVHSAAAISDLLRLTVAPQLRAHRSAAARAVELAHDGNQTEAAAWLGMGRSTFAKLLPST